MDLQEFVGKFAVQFEETEASEFKADTEFKNLIDWSSMIALSVIAMIDEEYNVTIKGEDIRKSKTIEDLFNIIKEQKSKA
jgi:acyl carrier protein